MALGELRLVRIIGVLSPWLRPHRKSLALLIVIRFMESLAEVAGITLFIPFLAAMNEEAFAADSDNVLSDMLGTLFQAVEPDSRLAVISLSIFGFILLRSLLDYVGSILAARLERELEHALRDNLMRQLLAADLAYLQKTQTGDLVNTLDNVVESVSGAIWTFLGMIVTGLMVSVFVAVLMLLSWELTLVVAVALLVISVVIKRLTRQVETLSTHQIAADQQLVQRALEILRGMRTVRAFNQENQEAESFSACSRHKSEVEYKVHRLSSLIEPVSHFLAGTLLVAVLFLSLSDPANLSIVLVFIFILYRLHPLMLVLDGTFYELIAAIPRVQHLVRVESESRQREVISGTQAIDRLSESIVFEGVSFRYPSRTDWALHHVTLCLNRGQQVALVGPSGAGKSTLIGLLQREFDPQEGRILVDGNPLPSLSLPDWRQLIAVVSQDIHLFCISVRANIAYGHPGASEDAILQAARRADAHEFILSLPQGYDTVLGEAGVLLSGGQRQRIAFARALLKNPQILILDEATNALDSLSESVVLETLKSLGEECTVVTIAHRLSTVLHCDQVVVLKDGCVVEQGPPSELLKNQAVFARLYELQQ